MSDAADEIERLRADNELLGSIIKQMEPPLCDCAVVGNALSAVEIAAELAKVQALLRGDDKSDALLKVAALALQWCLGLGAAPSEIKTIERGFTSG